MFNVKPYIISKLNVNHNFFSHSKRVTSAPQSLGPVKVVPSMFLEPDCYFCFYNLGFIVEICQLKILEMNKTDLVQSISCQKTRWLAEVIGCLCTSCILDSANVPAAYLSTLHHNTITPNHYILIPICWLALRLLGFALQL
jgi:hypothetical protein